MGDLDAIAGKLVLLHRHFVFQRHGQAADDGLHQREILLDQFILDRAVRTRLAIPLPEGGLDGTRLEDFQWLMNINFWGVVHGTQAFLPHLRKSGEGHVINISSIFGIVAIPQQSVYNAAKFAVRGYTEALRMELDLERQLGATHRVSATTVHPGGIKTNIAKSARVDKDALKAMNIDPDEARRRFEKNFITSPEKAAATIDAGARLPPFPNVRTVLSPERVVLHGSLTQASSACAQATSALKAFSGLLEPGKPHFGPSAEALPRAETSRKMACAWSRTATQDTGPTDDL